MPALQQDRSTDLRAGQVSRSKRRPYQDRYDDPSERRADKSRGDTCFDHGKEHKREGQHAQRAERGTGRIQRRRLLSTSTADQARFSLPTNFVFLD